MRFYRKVYPPDPKDAARAFDFSDPGFLRDFLRAAGKLTRAKGAANTEYVFMVSAEVGLYTTLHRLKARVHTSAIATGVAIIGKMNRPRRKPRIGNLA